MAPDLLSTIRHEIDERLSELRPLLAEYERLLGAADALVTTGPKGASAFRRTVTDAKPAQRKARIGGGRRGSAAGAIELVAAGSVETALRPVDSDTGSELKAAEDQRVSRPRRSAAKSKPERAARGAAREAILAALDHGSHTVGELAVVTAMSGPNINGNLRRLVSEGVVVKTAREGKAAWALANVSA
jgi:DNA-binding transcriptional ArsR family regulator